MGFISLPFYCLLLITTVLYFLLPKRCQWLVLLVASCVFYLSYGLPQIGFILVAAVIAWFAALRIQAIYDEPGEDNIVERKKLAARWLWPAIFGLAAMLIYAKIGDWLLTSLTQLFQHGGNAMQVIVALGISYYTFSLTSYLVDVYWQTDKAEPNFFKLLLFAIYFPKVLQGPISRHDFLSPQLVTEHSFDYKELCFGLQLMLWGYFKKMVIADRLGIFVNTVFGNIPNETGAHLLVAAIFSTIQLYCDFSGCMDIAGGFSQVLGIKLEKNFNHPFFSRSAAEFWRRWHITLGTWFKDYIYMPLATLPRLLKINKKIRKKFGTRAGKAVMSAVPMFAVWMFTAFWHGVSWNYLIWGLYWYVLVIIPVIFAPEIRRLATSLHVNTETGSWRVFQMVRTSVIAIVAMIIPQAGTPYNLLRIGKRLLLRFHPENFFDGTLYTLGLDRPNFILLVVCIFVLWVVSMLQEHGSVRERIAGCNIVFRWAIYYIAIFSIIIFGMYGPGYDAQAFIYMGF